MNKIIILCALVCLSSSLIDAGFLYAPPVPAPPAPVPAAGLLAPTVIRSNPPLVLSGAAPLPYYASPFASPYASPFGLGHAVLAAAAPVLASSPYAVYGK